MDVNALPNDDTYQFINDDAGSNNQQSGPFTPDQLPQMIGQGQIDRETRVRRQGMTGWEKTGALSGLEGLFGAVPRPLPTG